MLLLTAGGFSAFASAYHNCFSWKEFALEITVWGGLVHKPKSSTFAVSVVTCSSMEFRKIFFFGDVALPLAVPRWKYAAAHWHSRFWVLLSSSDFTIPSWSWKKSWHVGFQEARVVWSTSLPICIQMGHILSYQSLRDSECCCAGT